MTGDLLEHAATGDPSTATVTVRGDDRADHRVDPKLYGKFCEHLGNNIYHGMEAQVLFNPTFGEWHFRADERRPSGGYGAESDPDRVARQVREQGRPLAYPPETDPDALLAARGDGLAFGWQPAGEVQCSPDTGPSGNRAQRVRVDAAGGGVVQATRLPLHRVADYEFRTRIRAVEPTSVRVTVRSAGADVREAATADGEGHGGGNEDGDARDAGRVDDSARTVHDAATLDVGTEWERLEGELELPGSVDPDAVYEVALAAAQPAEVVVERLLVYPGDHRDYADPEVVEFLRESDLPLLRWPGGNFVSGYDWRDGVGPVDDRPVRPNPAWGGLEPNLFGTAEFVRFCEHVGCEPTICVNAGDGTPAEAAAWVEYCNGDPEETEMGRLRAEHGYPEPFDVTYWEVGNELWGEWQVHWTTPTGNADRYRRFREAMLDADPDIELTACGAVAGEDRPWNEVLLAECGADVEAVSSHPLAGGTVDADTDPDELYHAFMGYPSQLADQYADLEAAMSGAGVADPSLDVTELQLFARFAGEPDGDAGTDAGGTPALTPETMPTPTTVSEALYDACMRHALVRLGTFPRMLTHSATVNHGGGLQKAGERVWADPCHYGRTIGATQAGATPVAVAVECATVTTETTFREVDPVSVPAVDALATVDDGAVRVVLVNRASRTGPVTVSLAVESVDHADEATVTRLGGEELYAENTRADPERVTPTVETVPVDGDGTVTVELPSYTMARLDFERTP